MPVKNEIIDFARSVGADLVGVGGVEEYGDYLAEVRRRREETGAGLEDFMIRAGDTGFFERISDARQTMADARAVIIIGVGAYDTDAVYSNTGEELRGKTARTYCYYPVARQIGERIVEFIEEKGYRAAAGQDVPLKFVADGIGLGAYGKNGLLLTEQHGSYVALRSVITDMPLEADEFDKMETPCEDCGACLKACPTGALYAPYKVNPRL
ncbi:MAG: epoxyqueuosine reductase, partial [Planctomycetota bacterium]